MNERAMVNSDDEFDERIVGNPIHAYKTVKRFAIDLKKLSKISSRMIGKVTIKLASN